jgi:hypothetical protein
MPVPMSCLVLRLRLKLKLMLLLYYYSNELSSSLKVWKHVSPLNALIRLTSAGQRDLTSDGVQCNGEQLR